MAPRQGVAVRAGDQPRATTSSMDIAVEPARLQYKLKTQDSVPFIAAQFTNDYVVKVDAHSNSPIFMEDLRSLAFNLYKAQAIDKESLLELVDPPMKQMLREKLKVMEAKSASQPQQNVTPMPKKAG